MAETLELKRDTTTIDLLDGDPGWQIVDPGWTPKVCEYVEGRLPPPVEEVLKISGAGFASQDALATAEIALNKMGVAASRYIGDRTEEHPVWLHDQLNAETGERRALVREIRMAKLTEQHGVDCEGLILDAEPVFILTIKREQWERPTARDMPEATPRALFFDSGNTEPAVGETLTGDTSGHTGIVSGWNVTSGTWGGGNAAGVIYFSDTSGVFSNNEEIDGSVGGNNMMQANGTAFGGAAIVYDYTAAGAGGTPAAHDIVGDAPARIRALFLNEGAAQGITRIWAGIRSAGKHGATGVTQYQPIWECEDGSFLNNTAAVVDATASAGYKAQTTAGTTAWLRRVKITTSDVTANPKDQYGRALWILRAKITNEPWEVQLRYKNENATEYIHGKIVEIPVTGGYWDYYVMDIMPMGTRSLQTIISSDIPVDNTGPLGYWEVNIWARRKAGTSSGYVEFDCLCPVPVDEGFMSASNIHPSDFSLAAESPAGHWAGLSISDDGGNYEPGEAWVIEANNFRLPPGDGRIVAVYARDTLSVIDDYLIFNEADIGKYYERWHSLRGSE